MSKIRQEQPRESKNLVRNLVRLHITPFICSMRTGRRSGTEHGSFQSKTNKEQNEVGLKTLTSPASSDKTGHIGDVTESVDAGGCLVGEGIRVHGAGLGAKG